MIKRPGYSELFVCFILSFCMCMLHLMGGTWTMLLLLVPVGAVLDIYIFNKLGINYYGKLYTAYMWALGIMIVNAGIYLFKWQMGLQILMLVWLLLFLVFCVINLVQKIKNMIKTKQYASFNKMRSWILFAVGVAIPLVMEALLPAKAPLTIGIIGLGLYFVAGAALAGKDSSRQLLMYALCFGMITFTFCSLIRTQDAARNVVLQAPHDRLAGEHHRLCSGSDHLRHDRAGGLGPFLHTSAAAGILRAAERGAEWRPLHHPGPGVLRIGHRPGQESTENGK